MGRRESATPAPTDPTELAALQAGEDRHLFSPVGFLDDAWFHRSYWLYGRRYSSGCNWWSRAGQFTPGGRLLAVDESTVYGYGRKPSYFQWSVPLGYHLFACPRDPVTSDTPAARVSEIAIAKSDSLNPAGRPLTVECWVRCESGEGVVLARGGASHGYALVLSGGKPCFSVRLSGSLHTVCGADSLGGEWTHLCGVLTEANALCLYVAGKRVAMKTVPGKIAADPNEAMQIGCDRGSCVGTYDGPAYFRGVIDEVRVFSRALEADEIARRVSALEASVDPGGLVLAYSFDDATARDASGNGNDGGVAAVPAAGVVGRGFAFAGATGDSPEPTDRRRSRLKFQMTWSKQVPIHVRAMALVGDQLLAAGLPSMLDEEEAYRRWYDEDIQAQLRDQDSAFRGDRGGLLLIVSRADGRLIGQLPLAAPPVWDSLVAARGQVYLSTQSGEVLAFRGR